MSESISSPYNKLPSGRRRTLPFFFEKLAREFAAHSPRIENRFTPLKKAVFLAF